jgi:hypothetical protein
MVWALETLEMIVWANNIIYTTLPHSIPFTGSLSFICQVSCKHIVGYDALLKKVGAYSDISRHETKDGYSIYDKHKEVNEQSTW